MAALDRLKELQGGNVRPLDQYKVSNSDMIELLNSNFKTKIEGA